MRGLFRLLALIVVGLIPATDALADCQLRIAAPVNTGAGWLFTTHNDGTTACNAHIGMAAAPGVEANPDYTILVPMFGFPSLLEPQWVWINLGAEISVGPPGATCGFAPHAASGDARVCTAALGPGESFEVRFFVGPDSESSAACLTAVAGDDVVGTLQGPFVFSTVVKPATDTSPANNFRSICRGVAPGYPVIKSDEVDPVFVGSIVTYNIIVQNTYGVPTSSAHVVDTLPVGLVPQTATSPNFSCTISGQTVTCDQTSGFGDHGSSTVIEITALATQIGTVTNTCTAVNTGADPLIPDASQCTESTTILGTNADLDCSKTDATDPVAAGAPITYTIACANAGPQAASSVSFVDTLPAGTSFVSATGTGWSCSHAAGTVTCTRPTAAVGAMPSISIVANAPLTGGSVVNSCVVSSGTTDPTPADPNCNETTGVNPPVADLDCSKVDATDPVNAGAPINYTIACANAGPQAGANVVFSDTLPVGTTFVSASGAGWSCAHAAGIVTCTRPTAAVGALPSIAIVANAPLAGGSVVNSCVVSSDTTDPTPADPNCNETTGVNPPVADLDCSKVDATDPVNAGAPINYTIACANAGPQAGANVVFSDTLPVGTTFVSASGTGWICGHTAGVVTCTRLTAPVGALPSIAIVATAPAVGPVTNSCVVSSDTTDPTPADPNCNEVTGVTPITDLSIVKTDLVDPVLVGGTVTYGLAVANAGPSPAAAPHVVDTLPAGTAFVSASGSGWVCGHAAGVVTCDHAASAAVGALPSISITITAPGVPGTINNTATVSTSTTESTTANNTDGETTGVNGLVADLDCSKVDVVDPVNAGAPITWTISCASLGPDNAANVQLVDTLPAGTTFVSASGAGWSCAHAAGVVTCDLPSANVGALPDVTIVATAPAAGPVDNTCIIGSGSTDPTPADPLCNETTGVTPIADLSIVKTDDVDPVPFGGTITYTLTASNAGPSVAVTPRVIDTLPGSVAYVSAAGSGWTCAHVAGVVTCDSATNATIGAMSPITVVVTAPQQAGTVVNAAAVSTTTTESTLANNNTEEMTTVAGPQFDLSCTKVDAVDPVATNAVIRWTIDCANAGPDTATDVRMVDTLPAGTTFISATGSGWICQHFAGEVTCIAGNAVPGALPPITIRAAAPAVAGEVVNTCTITSGVPPTRAVSGAPGCVETTGIIEPSVDLSIVKTDLADPVQVGAPITYVLSVTNAGPNEALSLRVVDTLPVGMTMVTFGGIGWSCPSNANVISCEYLGIKGAPVGVLPDLTITVTAPATPGTINNTATVSSATPEINTANNTDTEPTTITGLVSELSCSKTDAVDPVGIGDPISWTIACANAGPDVATNVVINDELPAGVVFVSASGSGWTCSHTAGVVTCSTASAPIGSMEPITIEAIAPDVGGELLNVCAITSDNADPVAADQCDETTIVQPPVPPEGVVHPVPTLHVLGLLALITLVGALGMRRSITA